jgi:hypothetical protein
VTRPDRTPREPGPRRQADRPLIPDPRPGDMDMREMDDPDDLPFPDHWPHRPEYVIVVAQLRSWQPPSLTELLETRPARTREPEPDLEAEP